WGALSTLTLEDTRAMLDFRFRVAGGGELPFEPAALEDIYRYARGVPRSTCILCDNALLKTFLRGEGIVTAAAVTEVAQEIGTQAPEEPPRKVGRPAKRRKEVYGAAA